MRNHVSLQVPANAGRMLPLFLICTSLRRNHADEPPDREVSSGRAESKWYS